MNFEEKYNEILEWARKNKARLNGVPIEEVLPELAESEDERIRKRLIEYFEGFRIGNAKVKWEGLTVQDVLDWLEKQKELDKMIVVSPEVWDKAIADAYENGKKDGEKQKEQKPLPPFDEMSPEEKMNHPLYLEGFDMGREVQKVFDEQNPTDWSDEEKRKLNRIYSIIGWAMDEHAFSSCKRLLGDKEGVELQDFLRSIAKPKQEWSEEEKEILDNILSHYVLIDKPTDANGIPKEKYISLIKSIRFDTYKNCNRHWKPNEQEKGALRTAIHILTDERNFPKAAAHLQNILNAFEGEESRKDWKPSEEQMEALLNTLHPDDPYYHDLKSLYEQLKKL